MVALSDYGFRVLAIGFEEEEQETLTDLILQNQGILFSVRSELDLWFLLHQMAFDLFILKGGDILPNPSFLVWMIRGLLPEAHILLISDPLTIPEHESFTGCRNLSIIEESFDFSLILSCIHETIKALETSSPKIPMNRQIDPPLSRPLKP